MLGDIFEGTANIIGSYVGSKKRKEARDKAQLAYDESMQAYFDQDTSNLFANMENTMEDLTVNTQAADFAAAQQAQGLSNTLGQLRQAAGGSGIAALAQSLANQQSQNAIQASASIGQQEARNQALAAQQAGRLQMTERQGEAQSRALKAQLLGERLQIDAGELQQSEAAIQAARAQRAEGLGQFAGGVGNVVGMGIGGPAAVFGKLEAGQTRLGNFTSNYGGNLKNMYND